MPAMIAVLRFAISSCTLGSFLDMQYSSAFLMFIEYPIIIPIKPAIRPNNKDNGVVITLSNIMQHKTNTVKNGTKNAIVFTLCRSWSKFSRLSLVAK